MSTSEELFEAVKQGDSQRVAALLGAEPALLRERAPNGDSPLLTALYYRKPGIAALLIEHGADPSIFEAAALGDTTRLARLLDGDPASVNTYSHDGWTPLHLAAHFGQTEAARVLLTRGADASLRSTNALDNLPLHAALAGGDNVALVTLLIESGSDVNARQHGGYTPLHEAAQNGYLGSAQRLLAAGADASVATADGQTPLALARGQGHGELEALLRAHGATA